MKRTFTSDELKIIHDHSRWLRVFSDGKRANLTCAALSDADLGDADLSDADLSGAKADIHLVLDAAPSEVPGLLAALRAGKINGSAYEGECACLVGTIANVRGCNYREIANLAPNINRPAERLFLAINTGNTPENHPIAKLIEEWIVEWQAERAAVPAVTP